MSLFKKDITEELVETRERVSQLETELADQVAQNQSIEAQNVIFSESIDELKETVNLTTGEVAGHLETIEGQRNEIHQLQTEVDRLKDAAQHPAYCDATEGTEPLDETGAEEGKDLWSTYQAITDPAERILFWRTHGKTIIQQQGNN